MYESIRIQNFRGLKDLTIENLGRVNLLVGANNVGKTSVLEALALLHMHRDGYELALMLESRGFRRDESTAGAIDSLCRQTDEGGNRSFSVSGTLQTIPETDPVSNELSAFGTTWRNPSSHSDSFVTVAVVGREAESLRFEFVERTELAGRVAHRVMNGPNPVHVLLGQPRSFPRSDSDPLFGQCVYLPIASRLPLTALADLLSASLDRGVLESVVDSASIADKRIGDIRLSFSRQEQSVSVAAGMDMGGKLRWRSIASLGNGSRRLLELALLLPLGSQGIGLIDEIDGGIYYKNLMPLWDRVDQISQSASVQLFATTHSLECVEAAVRAFDGKHASDFRIHRLSRRDDDVRVTTYDHEAAEATLNVGVEFR